MTQAQPVFPVQNVAEAYLAQIVTALLVVAALCQFIPGVAAGDIGVEIRGVVREQAPSFALRVNSR